MKLSFKRHNKGGFTLIEIVIVIAIIGILAAMALPKFIDMSGSAKVAATKAGLGAVRSVLATKYASSATGGATASYPASLAIADFAGGDLPKNLLSTLSGVTAVSSVPAGTATNTDVGFWFMSGPTNSTAYGKAGAYSDATGVTDTSAY